MKKNISVGTDVAPRTNAPRKVLCGLCGTPGRLGEMVLGTHADICPVCVQIETALLLVNKLLSTSQARARHFHEALSSLLAKENSK